MNQTNETPTIDEPGICSPVNRLAAEARGRFSSQPCPDCHSASKSEGTINDQAETFTELKRSLRSRVVPPDIGPSSPKDDLVGLLSDGVLAGQGWKDGYERMMRDTCYLNVEAYTNMTGKEADRWREEVRDGHVEELARRLTLDWEPPVCVLRAEVMVNEPARLYAIISDKLGEMCDGFVDAIEASLTRLLEEKVIGWCEQLSEDVWKYYYRTWAFIRTEGKPRKGRPKLERIEKRDEDGSRLFWDYEIITTKTDHKLVKQHRTIWHHLYHASLHPLAATNLNAPWYVQDYISRQIPEWAGPIMRVVSGAMSLEQIVAEDIAVRKSTKTKTERQLVREGRLWSPGVCFGSFCLTGWSDREL